MRGGEGVPGVVDGPVVEAVHVGGQRAAGCGVVVPGRVGAGGELLQQPPPRHEAERGGPGGGGGGEARQGPQAHPASQLPVRAGHHGDAAAAGIGAGLGVSEESLVAG